MESLGNRFLVIGLGPSGATLAAHLASQGCRVSCIERNDLNREAIGFDGISITGKEKLNAPVYELASSISNLKENEFDAVFVAIKTTGLASVAEDMKQLPGDFKIVVFQNGIDNEHFLCKAFPGDRVLRVAINYAGIVQSPGVIKMTFFMKPNFIGCLCSKGPCKSTREIAALLTQSGLDTEGVQDIGAYTWKKTILNASLSAICAITGLNIAQVMNSPATYPLVEEVLKECIQVAAAVGYDFGDDFLETCMHYLGNAGAHKPSMLQDLERHRPTEIGFINGKIVDYGERFGVPVPVNRTITAMVTAIEQRILEDDKKAQLVEV